MSTKHNHERAKNQPVDPEIRHLQLVRSSEVERAADKAFRAMDENHHGAALKLTPSEKHDNVVQLDDYRQKAMMNDQPSQAPVNNQPYGDNVVSLDDHRQRVEQVHAEQEISQQNPRDMFNAPEAA